VNVPLLHRVHFCTTIFEAANGFNILMILLHLICAVHIMVIKHLSRYMCAYFSPPCLHNICLTFEFTEFIVIIINVSDILHYFKLNIS
jgi:hypothetical protein